MTNTLLAENYINLLYYGVLELYGFFLPCLVVKSFGFGLGNRTKYGLYCWFSFLHYAINITITIFCEQNRNNISYHRCTFSYSQQYIGSMGRNSFWILQFQYIQKRLYNVSYRYKLGIIGLILCIFSFITANYLPLFLSPLGGLFAPLFGPLGWLLLAKTFQDSKLLDYLNYWGLNSLNLMVTHYSIVMVLFSIIIEKGFGKSFNGWITIICFLLSLPIQYLLVIVINRYAKFTLGK